MNFTTNWRDRRTLFAPTQYSIANYNTDTKTEMMNTFGDEIFLKNLHLIPDPLKKNLADTLITKDEKMAHNLNLEDDMDHKIGENIDMVTDYSPLGGITSFFSGVFNIISNAMFSKRKQSDMSSDTSRPMAVPSMWHGAKILDENKTLLNQICSNNTTSEVPEMECRAAATKCQSKINQIRVLVGSKPVPCSVRVRRRPKKVFVEPGSVEDCFEDAFSPEDFETLADDSFIPYYSPVSTQEPVFQEIDGPKVQTKLDNSPTTTNKTPAVCETMEIVKNVPEIDSTNVNKLVEDKKELVASCEDKITKLKALLQERRKNRSQKLESIETDAVVNQTIQETPNIIVTTEEQKTKEFPPKTVSKTKDKQFKNGHRCTDKRRKSRMRKNINDDLLFANEIHSEELSSSVDNSPSMNTLQNYLPRPDKEYFDEVTGCFHSSSVDSDDCFQIVFKDTPHTPKVRRPSDCDSEDSFIIFEDSPTNCYTTNDVFGDTSDSDDYDSDSDLSDSGCGTMTFNLASSLSKSVSNLTDDSLYTVQSEDEVDCAQNSSEPLETELSTGLLIDEQKKKHRRGLPPKKVQFSSEPPKVHVMRVWAFAARQARCGHWAQYSLDRDRFKRRIADVDMAVSWVLKPQHRSRVMFQRFMPWWNAQKRKELAEKKEQKAEEKRMEEELKAEEMLRTVEESNLDVKESLNAAVEPATAEENIVVIEKGDDLNTKPEENTKNKKKGDLDDQEKVKKEKLRPKEKQTLEKLDMKLNTEAEISKKPESLTTVSKHTNLMQKDVQKRLDTNNIELPEEKRTTNKDGTQNKEDGKDSKNDIHINKNSTAASQRNEK